MNQKTPVLAVAAGLVLAGCGTAQNHSTETYLNAACTLEPGIVQVTVTDDHDFVVYATNQDINVYDSAGDFLGTVVVPLGVTSIPAGDTITASASDPYQNAVTCVLDGYNDN